MRFFRENMTAEMELERVIAFLNQCHHPALNPEWASTKGVVRQIQGPVGTVFLVELPFAGVQLLAMINDWVFEQSQDFEDMPAFEITQDVKALKVQKTRLKGVKNIIVVSSAKGGVGKSTTAVNLALGLKAQGAEVGLLDADIYGPSLPVMMGTKGQYPTSLDGKMMEPVKAHGIVTNSIGYLVPDENATVWRGPMASKAFSQLMMETHWGNLDYLIVDMPPGTGDIQLSLAQQFPVTSAIVVTTPQDLALADAIKGVAMFDKVEVPVLGIVENMSYHTCSQCGHHETIFGSGGAVKMGEHFGLSVLAQIPLHMSIRKDLDEGNPSVVADPTSEHAQAYSLMALRVASQMYWMGEVALEEIDISVSMN